MISILIPTYNYNIVPLVKELHKQCSDCRLKFEILVYDDGSKSLINEVNNQINLLENCNFKELPNNIGRSAIRNLMANNAIFENLLFVDAGTFPKEKIFIKNYISIKHKAVVHGGMTWLANPPKAPFKLRWVYTKKRESKKGLHSCNFLIQKKIFKKNYFDESLNKYGYEDVLFFDLLQKKNIEVYTTKNPVIHSADDDANTFIKKNEDAIENLIALIGNNTFKKNRIGISKYYYLLKKIKLNKLTAVCFKMTKPLLIKNLNSSYPLLILFDFYRLGFFCQLKNKE